MPPPGLMLGGVSDIKFMCFEQKNSNGPFSITSLIGTSIAFMVIIVAFAVGLATLLGVYEKNKITKEKRELKEEIDYYLGMIEEGRVDVLTLITRNLTLLREAYIISNNRSEMSFQQLYSPVASAL
jgi:hypothetical protein